MVTGWLPRPPVICELSLYMFSNHFFAYLSIRIMDCVYYQVHDLYRITCMVMFIKDDNMHLYNGWFHFHFFNYTPCLLCKSIKDIKKKYMKLFIIFFIILCLVFIMNHVQWLFYIHNAFTYFYSCSVGRKLETRATSNVINLIIIIIIMIIIIITTSTRPSVDRESEQPETQLL